MPGLAKELTSNLPQNVQRLVVLNKAAAAAVFLKCSEVLKVSAQADLVTPNVGLAMRNLIQEAGQPCLPKSQGFPL